MDIFQVNLKANTQNQLLEFDAWQTWDELCLKIVELFHIPHMESKTACFFKLPSCRAKLDWTAHQTQPAGSSAEVRNKYLIIKMLNFRCQLL